MGISKLLSHQAVELQKGGMTVTDIATRLEVSTQQVSSWFRSMEYSPWVYHAGTMVEMYKGGLSAKEIGERVGLSKGLIESGRFYDFLRKHGVPRKKVPSRKPKCPRCHILLSAFPPFDECADCQWELETGQLAILFEGVP